MSYYDCYTSMVSQIDGYGVADLVEMTESCYENEQYDDYDDYCEMYGRYVVWRDDGRPIGRNRFEDLVTDYREFGSHEIG